MNAMHIATPQATNSTRRRATSTSDDATQLQPLQGLIDDIPYPHPISFHPTTTLPVVLQVMLLPRCQGVWWCAPLVPLVFLLLSLVLLLQALVCQGARGLLQTCLRCLPPAL